jgi:hypothetical protein
MGTRDCVGVKRPGREADDSPPSSAEVKEWVVLYLQSPNTPYGVVLSYKKGAGITLPLPLPFNLMAWYSGGAQGQLYLLPFTHILQITFIMFWSCSVSVKSYIILQLIMFIYFVSHVFSKKLYFEAGYCINNAVDLNSEGTRFVSRPGYRLSWMRCFDFNCDIFRQMLGQCLLFIFLSHSMIYNICTWNNVVK